MKVDLYIDISIGIDINTDAIILQKRKYDVLFVCITWNATH